MSEDVGWMCLTCVCMEVNGLRKEESRQKRSTVVFVALGEKFLIDKKVGCSDNDVTHDKNSTF